jgi:hypothetical protein
MLWRHKSGPKVQIHYNERRLEHRCKRRLPELSEENASSMTLQALSIFDEKSTPLLESTSQGTRRVLFIYELKKNKNNNISATQVWYPFSCTLTWSGLRIEGITIKVGSGSYHDEIQTKYHHHHHHHHHHHL